MTHKSWLCLFKHLQVLSVNLDHNTISYICLRSPDNYKYFFLSLHYPEMCIVCNGVSTWNILPLHARICIFSSHDKIISYISVFESCLKSEDKLSPLYVVFHNFIYSQTVWKYYFFSCWDRLHDNISSWRATNIKPCIVIFYFLLFWHVYLVFIFLCFLFQGVFFLQFFFLSNVPSFFPSFLPAFLTLMSLPFAFVFLLSLSLSVVLFSRRCHQKLRLLPFF